MKLACEKLNNGLTSANKISHIPHFFIYHLTLKIINSIWHSLIWNVLPILGEFELNFQESNDLGEKYIYTKIAKNKPELELWPSQIEAAKASVKHDTNMVFALPTSACKTKIAEMCILRALSLNQKIIYVTPLRALSAQVENILKETFSKLGVSVSSLYGASGISKVDVDIAKDNQIVVATPEKLDYILRVAPETLNSVGLIILDEGHTVLIYCPQRRSTKTVATEFLKLVK